jgi:hypothetical protein
MNQHVLDHHGPSTCANCAATVSGNFCHECGQETVLHPPSTREFLHEFIGHYVALESKLWQTLKLLILKPGALTLEYMAGRRVRYIEPLRVYLTLSLVFFALFKTIQFVDHDEQKPPPSAQHQKAAAVAKPAASGDKATSASAAATSTPAADADDDQDDLGDRIDAAVAAHQAGKADKADKAPKTVVKIDGADKGFAHFVSKLVEGAMQSDNSKLKAGFFGYAPYAMFALMPVFALYLKILYLGSGRRYGEHLLFALHTNAFAFLMLSVMILFEKAPFDVPFLAPALFFWLAFYLPLAMRRVYGGRKRTTALRWFTLMMFHLLGMSVAVALVFYAAVSH